MTTPRPKRPNSKPGRVDLIPEEFDNAIEDQGTFVRITPAAVCPNRTDLTDTNHKLDCALCGGEGVIDFDDQAFEDWALILGIKKNERFEVGGIWDVRDATMTVMKDRRISYMYRIEVLDFSSVFNQVIKRASANSDKTRYAIASEELGPFILTDSDGRSYEKDVDYQVSGKEIVWLGLKRPRPGSLFTFVYPMRPTYRVLELIHENRYYYTSFKEPVKTAVQLPQQAVIRHDFMIKGQGANELRSP